MSGVGIVCSVEHGTSDLCVLKFSRVTFFKVTCLATMVALRKLNRLDKHRLKATRDAVKENRSRVDGLHLQLQNLAYEAGHLRSEVDKCLEFK